MQKPAHKIYAFDGFALDLTRGCLLRGQEEIKLRPKSFEALKYLVENNGRLISKDELIHAVWVDTAVTDDSLVKCLKHIRHALSDETQQLIKTVHGRGYIFDSEVSENGAVARTTYAEETQGVQVIIEEEEETNGHKAIETQLLPASRNAGLLPERRATSFERVTTAIKQHRWSALLGVLTLAVAASAVVYFTRPGETIDSIAVMPFVNVNSDPNTDYLSEGISESIINSLSPNLKVIALNSVLRYKGKQTDPQVVGRELNVQSVLISRLTQRGDDLAISVELVDVRDNRHLWGQQYNRKLADINRVQTEIARDVSESLRLKLSGEEKKRLAKRYTENGEAYRLYLTGRYFQRKGRKRDSRKALNSSARRSKKIRITHPLMPGWREPMALLD
jgi:TolB-like protein/DNA-binding winged helix-turn-helix (wHTH) protein